MISGMFLFDQPVDPDWLRFTIERRLLRYERFRMRVSTRRSTGTVSWTLDDKFDLSRHFTVCSLPKGAGEAELFHLVSDLMSTQLDLKIPLWHFHLVTNYQGGSALIARLHHAIADGIALMKVLLTLTDPEPTAPAERDEEPEIKESSRKVRKLKAPKLHASREIFVKKILEKRPFELVDVAKEAGKLGKMLLLDGEPKTPLRGALGLRKLAAVSRPIPLEDVKAARRRVGGTVNDILMAALTGGLRRYLARRGYQAGEDVSLRAVVPVDLRRSSDSHLGNKFGMVFLALPVGLDTPAEQFAEVKKRMDALKGGPQAVVVFGLLSAVGTIPAELQTRVVEFFGSKSTLVVTNVPGPEKELYLAGQAIKSLMFWVPQSGRLGLGVSILSYGGHVRVGVACDEGVVSDPEQLVNDFHDAYDELVR
jgi:WS/DGAT/MGAT family acyltransferase